MTRGFEIAGEGAGPRTRGTTGVNNIRVVQARLEIRRNSFSQRVVNTWNTLPGTVKSVKTVLAFKIAYDELVKGGEVGSLRTETDTAPNHSHDKEHSYNATCSGDRNN